MGDDFHGAKALVFIGKQVLVYLRDDSVPMPSLWDFPGGGREEQETPEACLRREMSEEFGLTVPDDAIVWRSMVPSMVEPRQSAWFFMVTLPAEARDHIRFGDEGQRWALMTLKDVTVLPNLVPALRDRLMLWLQQGGREPI